MSGASDQMHSDKHPEEPGKMSHICTFHIGYIFAVGLKAKCCCFTETGAAVIESFS